MERELELRDEFWYDKTATQFGKDLQEIVSSIRKVELDRLNKLNIISSCWHVCVYKPSIFDDSKWFSTGTKWSREIGFSYNFFYLVDTPKNLWQKLVTPPSLNHIFNLDYWLRPSYEPIWFCVPGYISKTISK